MIYQLPQGTKRRSPVTFEKNNKPLYFLPYISVIYEASVMHLTCFTRVSKSDLIELMLLTRGSSGITFQLRGNPRHVHEECKSWGKQGKRTLKVYRLSAFSDLRKSGRVWGESLEEGLSDPHLYRCGSPPSEWTHERCGVKRLSFRFHPS